MKTLRIAFLFWKWSNEFSKWYINQFFFLKWYQPSFKNNEMKLLSTIGWCKTLNISKKEEFELCYFKEKRTDILHTILNIKITIYLLLLVIHLLHNLKSTARCVHRVTANVGRNEYEAFLLTSFLQYPFTIGSRLEAGGERLASSWEEEASMTERKCNFCGKHFYTVLNIAEKF